MMNFNFNFFKKKKKKDIKVEEIEEEVSEDIFHYHKDDDIKVSNTLKIGDKVIVISNEPNGVFSGELVNFDRITQARNVVPIVKSDIDEKFYMPFGLLLPFDQEMFDKLMSLSNDKSAWNYLAPSWAQCENGQKFR